MKRILIAGTHSGCGKTTVVCAVLQALVNRKISAVSFKCGPDYIDPMFHSRITGVPAYNLDRKFCDKDTVNFLLNRNVGYFAVIEGVMGFYDGADENSSSCAISLDTETPAIIVIDCKGMSLSIGAVMRGFLDFRRNKIAGFIFNRLPESLTEQTKNLCEELHTEYLGRLPFSPEYSIESRHLGLVTAEEISDLKSKMQILAENAEKHIALDHICEIAKRTETVSYKQPQLSALTEIPVRIAVAKDKSFCFYYEENFDLLRSLGCEIVPFSPLSDKRLPENICGLWLGGGYPELYAEQLAENDEMLSEIHCAVTNGMPTIAECGGFLYLCKEVEDFSGRAHKMAGIFGGRAYRTDSLKRFGYADLTANSDNLLCEKDDTLKTHEYHYWDCTNFGTDLIAHRKNGVTDLCVHADKNIYAGFPHLYLWANPKAAERFVKRCLEYRENETDK